MANPSDHFANERTFLAWIRTGIALIGFGFVIAKFIIFINLLKPSGSSSIKSIIYGEVMIILGAITIVYGLYLYLSYEKDLEKGYLKPKKKENSIFASIIIIFAVALSFLLLI